MRLLTAVRLQLMEDRTRLEGCVDRLTLEQEDLVQELKERQAQTAAKETALADLEKTKADREDQIVELKKARKTLLNTIERLTCEQKKTSEDLSATRDKLHSVQSERNEVRPESFLSGVPITRSTLLSQLDGEKSSLVESMRLLNIQLNRTTVERETLFRKVEERDDRIATVTKELERLGLDSGAQVAKLQSELEAARKEVAECRAAW